MTKEAHAIFSTIVIPDKWKLIPREVILILQQQRKCYPTVSIRTAQEPPLKLRRNTPYYIDLNTLQSEIPSHILQRITQNNLRRQAEILYPIKDPVLMLRLDLLEANSYLLQKVRTKEKLESADSTPHGNFYFSWNIFQFLADQAPHLDYSKPDAVFHPISPKKNREMKMVNYQCYSNRIFDAQFKVRSHTEKATVKISIIGSGPKI
jgi:hypothetical protein